MKSNHSILLALVLGASLFALTSCGKTSSVAGIPSTPPPVLDTTPPATPMNLHGWFDVATNRDYVGWDLSSSADVVAYEVYVVPVGGTPSQVGTFDATANYMILPVTSFTGTEVYRVRAVDAAGNHSGYSTSSNVTRHGWVDTGAGTEDSGDGNGKMDVLN